MTQPTFSTNEPARDLVNQTLTARRWTLSHLTARLKTRTDGRAFTVTLMTALARRGGLANVLAQMFAQLPHLLREALAPEPPRPWAALIGHNTRVLHGEIESLMTALAQVALGHVRLGEVFQVAAAELQADAAQLEQELAAETERFTEVQREHHAIVQELQASRMGWLAFLLRLFKGDALTRLVNASNERVSLAFEMDVHQAAAALLAQAAEAAHRRATLLAARAEALDRARDAAQAELAALETRLHSKPPFLTESADNWTILGEWRQTHSNPSAESILRNEGLRASLPQSLVQSLADANTSAEAHLEAIQVAAQQDATIEAQGLNVVTAFETEAQCLGIPLDSETHNPILLVGEALLVHCLETHPRFWLSPLARPREFLFQVAPDSAAPFDLAEGSTARFDAERGTQGYLGFIHVQLGLAREDFEAYAQTRDAFLAAQADHNLFVIEELAKQRNRRKRKTVISNQ